MSSFTNGYEPWPALPYQEFKSTQYLLHMGVQAIGKLKLITPFEPHWANVALWVSAQGLTTGPIPYGPGIFSVDVDLINHQIVCRASWGTHDKFSLDSMSVAQLTDKLFKALHSIGVNISINLMPQEVPHPIPFMEDTVNREYSKDLANAWFRILASSYRVMQRYHARFNGSTPAIGLMWGTFDLRDARYRNIPVPTEGANAGYIRRNAMDVMQVESGWWSGNDEYPRAAYFSFLYPEQKGIDTIQVKPQAAHWDKVLGEFILDYDDLRASKNPEADLLQFLESTYEAEALKAGWDPKLINIGEPVG